MFESCVSIFSFDGPLVFLFRRKVRLGFHVGELVAPARESLSERFFFPV